MKKLNYTYLNAEGVNVTEEVSEADILNFACIAMFEHWINREKSAEDWKKAGINAEAAEASARQAWAQYDAVSWVAVQLQQKNEVKA